MEIKLYKYNGGSNVINKDLELIVTYSFNVKKSTDIIRPILPIFSEIDLITSGVNYCYISVLNRYYFIDGISPYPNNIFRLDCRVDVLESFKNDILNSESQIIVGNELDYSSSVDVDSRQDGYVYKGTNNLDDVFDYVLVTLGG